MRLSLVCVLGKTGGCVSAVFVHAQDGHTAFMRAAEAGLLDVGRYLVSAGANASHVKEVSGRGYSCFLAAWLCVWIIVL